MDLNIFHYPENPDHNYKRFDRHNASTGFHTCRMLDYLGWYNMSIPLRLLGHYRRFQAYKKRRRHRAGDLPPIQSYILQYRPSERLRRYSSIVISRWPSLWGIPDESVEMHAINKLLIYERVAVLTEFLTDADIDFEAALDRAVQQIHDPEFISIPAKVEKQKEIIVEKEKEITVKETIIKEVAPAKELTGKVKDVFSKKQVLILFQLLAESRKIESLDLGKPGKRRDIARFLQALTGKGEATWLEILQDYQNKDLYEFHTNSERSHLLATLTNMAEIADKAGIQSVTSLIELKIRKLKLRE
jgi:hypothetical protein